MTTAHCYSELSRRQLLRAGLVAGAGLAVGGLPLLSSCGESPAGPGDGTALLRQPSLMEPFGDLRAGVGSLKLSQGGQAAALLYNDELPGPTIRCTAGVTANLRLLNALPEPTIIHWHGLVVPTDADGHPRDMISPGSTYEYAFPLRQRAGTFWYHPHAHHLTASQVHRGLAGFLLIGDEEESSLNLPSGDREILLMIQDFESAMPDRSSYALQPADHFPGLLGDVAYVNGQPRPSVMLPRDAVRLRLLNASHARVYLLAFEDRRPFVVIGNDGGLLPEAVTCQEAYLGVGERLDVLLDLSGAAAGERLMLQSIAFAFAPSAGARFPQGMPMDVLEVVAAATKRSTPPPMPDHLSSIPSLPPPSATQLFVFTSATDGSSHRINGMTFDVNRVDTVIPLGASEQWVFQNETDLPHPVHVHGTHFQVISRSGGRGVVYPYEHGWKDTVLTMPHETVAVRIRFEHYRGLYLLHCHNLQHEDAGMMLNVSVT